jgi:death-on-curing protein
LINWPHQALALAIHDRLLDEHGGSSGVRDENLLELALARPKQLFAYREPRPDLAELAATLAFVIARNHPFVDANKRTALVAYQVFLALNSAELRASDDEKYMTIVALAEGKLSEKRFADWLRERVRISQPRPAKSKRKKAARKKAKRR